MAAEQWASSSAPLDEGSVQVRRAAPRDAEILSRRQREVVVLIARGLSNREIAAELVIAERTAETHVEHILRKLGLTSRTQVATWALGPRVDAAVAVLTIPTAAWRAPWPATSSRRS